MKIRRLLTPLVLLLAVALLAAPFQAYTTYRDPNGFQYDIGDLFYTSLHRKETTSIEVRDGYGYYYGDYDWQRRTATSSDEDGYRQVELDYVTRYPSNKTKEMRLTENATVASNIAVVIPKTHTLVVEQGTTLNVYGKLIIEGKLENDGLIVVGNKKLSDVSNDKLSEVRVYGTLDNYNTIRAYRGTVVNHGELGNDGTILSANKVGLDGIVNKSGGALYNDGTIRLENTDDMGLRNESGGTLENNGSITRLKSASATGNIRGRSATVAAE